MPGVQYRRQPGAGGAGRAEGPAQVPGGGQGGELQAGVGAGRHAPQVSLGTVFNTSLYTSSSLPVFCVSAVRIITVYRAAATRNPSHHSGYLDTYCANIRSFSPVFRNLVWSLDRCITN